MCAPQYRISSFALSPSGTVERRFLDKEFAINLSYQLTVKQFHLLAKKDLYPHGKGRFAVPIEENHTDSAEFITVTQE